MGMSAGRKKFYKNIAASPEEREIFKELVAKGVKVEIRIVPANNAVSVEGLLKK